MVMELRLKAISLAIRFMVTVVTGATVTVEPIYTGGSRGVLSLFTRCTRQVCKPVGVFCHTMLLEAVISTGPNLAGGVAGFPLELTT